MHATLLAIALLWPSAAVLAASPIVYDANDVPLGVWVQSPGGEQETVMTRTGYCVGLIPRIGGFVIPECFFQAAGLGGDFLYESTDCSGPALSPADEFVRGGFVAPGPSGTLRYSPRGQVPTIRTVQSRRDNTMGVCAADSGAIRTLHVLPNDEAVTGISAILALPLEIRVEDRCIFSDGFDCPA